MGNLANQLNNIGTTPPTQNLTQDSAGGVRATRVEGEHDNRDHERILVACGHDPSRVRFAAPPAVYVKLDEGSSRVYTTYRYKLEEVPVDFSTAAMARWRDNLAAPAMITDPDVIPATYVVKIADSQFGKPGTDTAIENWKRGVTGHVNTIRNLQALGQSPEGVHVAWMGDETEGIANNYTNQSHIIELNQSQQLELDFDMRVWTLKQYATLGLPISASSVISNHGEFTRNGGKDPVTSRYDNSSTYVARQVKKLFDEAEAFGGPHIDWTIGENDPGVVVELSGERCYFSHMYVEKGRGASTELRTKNAVEKQILGDIPRLGDVRIWFAAHFHHMYSNEFEGKTLFGCPALEAPVGSKEYMKDQFGVWSPPGMLGMLVGSGFEDRGWSNVNVF